MRIIFAVLLCDLKINDHLHIVPCDIPRMALNDDHMLIHEISYNVNFVSVLKVC